MKVYYDLTPSTGDTAVALGNFDGLHLGHQKVIASAVSARAQGFTPTVFTFAANPLADLGGRSGGEIITREQKIALLEALGVEQLYIIEFCQVKDLAPEAFVDWVLTGVCRAREVCCGFNFTFGSGGKATSETLSELCESRGIKVEIAGAVLSGGEPVSSTRIRGLIAAGEVDEAVKLLGRPYGYCSKIQHGRKLGRELGAPTLNQAIPGDFVLPRFGVYASSVYVDGVVYAGVTNVGIKPTVGSPCALAETWMPDYRGEDLYGRTVRVDLMKFIRPERRFSGLEELKAEIIRNGVQAKEYFEQNSGR